MTPTVSNALLKRLYAEHERKSKPFVYRGEPEVKLNRADWIVIVALMFVVGCVGLFFWWAGR